MARCTPPGFVLLAALTVRSVACGDAYQPVAGRPHPDVVLPEIRSGEPVSLEQYRGKRVLLIHFASW